MQPRDSLKSKRPWLWPVALAATIVIASTRSRVAEPHFANSDKVAHFAVYGLLASLVCRLGRGWRAAAGGVLVVSAFGVTDEWHQRFVPGRTCDVKDWMADTGGAVLAVVLYTAWPRYRALLEFPLGRKRRIEKTTAPATLPDA
jgi:VanZ family protein